MAELWLLNKARRDLAWQEKRDAPGGEQTADMKVRRQREEEKQKKDGTGKTIAIFLAASAVTLVAGVVLEQSGDGIACT